MYLNSTTNQTVWDCIVRTLGNQQKNEFPVIKRVKKNGIILDIIENFKILNRVFQAMSNKKSLEITYAMTLRLMNAQHLTMYQKT